MVDLDAAMGVGDNREIIRSLLPLAKCRVGGEEGREGEEGRCSHERK